MIPSFFSSVMSGLISAAMVPAGEGPARGAWMPGQGSEVSAEVDFVFNFITWISIFFFVVIVALTVYFAWIYRRRAGFTPGNSPAHNTPLELAWTIVPLFLVIAIFYVGMKGFVRLREAPADAYVIEVTGKKWAWEFVHPDGTSGFGVLDVPVGRPVKLVMKSDDVLHSMFIPAFRVKQDVVPGRYTELWFTAVEAGRYDLFCTEYCGSGHSTMTTFVNAWEPDDFDMVIAEKGAIFEDAAPFELGYLAAANLYSRCKSCHSVDGSRLTGPSFTETHQLFLDKGNRELTNGESVLVDRQYIYDAIVNPAKHVVATYGPVMPANFGVVLSEPELDGLVRMIIRLDETFDTDGNPVDVANAVPAAGDSTSEESTQDTSAPDAGE